MNNYEEIRAHAEELAQDMNLRLICEMPLSDISAVLWVENICVTGIEYPQICKPADKAPAFTVFLKKFFNKIFRRLSSGFRHGFFIRQLGHDKR
jgi:hypothetical protein